MRAPTTINVPVVLTGDEVGAVLVCRGGTSPLSPLGAKLLYGSGLLIGKRIAALWLER